MLVLVKLEALNKNIVLFIAMCIIYLSQLLLTVLVKLPRQPFLPVLHLRLSPTSSQSSLLCYPCYFPSAEMCVFLQAALKLILLSNTTKERREKDWRGQRKSACLIGDKNALAMYASYI